MCAAVPAVMRDCTYVLIKKKQRHTRSELAASFCTCESWLASLAMGLYSRGSARVLARDVRSERAC